MKKKLKTLFSPRKLFAWLFIIILILAVPELTKPAMSQTEAIVSMMCIDKVDDEIKIATIVLTPALEKTADYEVYTGTGETVGEAVENVSLALGKSMGFAQCEIMAIGDNLASEGIMSSLDFMTRTRKVGRNAILVNFSGEVDKFAQAIVNLNVEKSLHIEDIMNFDKRYILSDESNIHSFYKGYFSDISQGLMPKIKLENENEGNAIEVQDGSTGSGTTSQQGNSSGDSKKSYILNDGTTCIFKNGKKLLELAPEQVKKVNIFLNKSQEGVIKVKNVNDYLYDNANVVLNLTKKDLKFKPSFDKGTPKFNIGIELSVLVEEIDEGNPNKRFLKRNKEFLTDALIERTIETVKSDAYEIVEFCKLNKIDLMHVYEYFDKFNHKQFKNYVQTEKENYLNDIEFSISVKVNSSY